MRSCAASQIPRRYAATPFAKGGELPPLAKGAASGSERGICDAAQEPGRRCVQDLLTTGTSFGAGFH